jgi:uncharacterized membrane protein YphA (DoxX/SURF4 family)
MVEWWSWQRKFAFRFGVIAAALLMTEHVFVFIPSATVLLAVLRGWHWLSSQFGSMVGFDVPPLEFTGSGDQLWLYLRAVLCLIFAMIGATVWTLTSLAPAHPRLATVSVLVLRYYLAVILIGYGMAKVVPVQFPPLFLARYDQAIGEMSPMGLLWTFMSHSQVYTWFAGIAEVIGSVLLLSRRTYVIGATILLAVMSNVVLLNYCYDVPVKLFSTQLLVFLFVLVAPHARRLVAALLGYPTREVSPRVRGSITTERVRLAFKLVAIGMVALHAATFLIFREQIRDMRRPSELQGIWRAERVVIDGVERPPLLTDDARWRKLIFHEYGGLVVRFTTDRRQWFQAKVDPKSRTISLGQGVLRHVWRYQRVGDDRLVIDTPNIHAELVREPPPLLPTRGFHWVQEAPYHR